MSEKPASSTLVIVSLGIGLILGAAAGVAWHRPPAEDPRAEIEALIAAQSAAWNKGDLDAFVVPYWDDEGLTFYSGGDVNKGLKAVIERYRKRYKSEGRVMGRLTFSDLEVHPLSPGTAMARGRWKVERPAAAGKGEEVLEGLYTLLLRKLPEGWRIVHDHTSKK